MKNKKLVAVVLLLAAFASLAAGCGDETPADTTANTSQTNASAVPPVKTASPNDNAAASPAEEKTEENIVVDPVKKQAEELVGSDVQELYDAIGYPESSDYASSCLGSGEDGELVYEGFVVYTYREGNSETVRSVE